MSEWVNQTYHSTTQGGDCFSVRTIDSGPYMSPVPYLCILKDGDWYRVAKFPTWKRAKEFCTFFEEHLGCTDTMEQ